MVSFENKQKKTPWIMTRTGLKVNGNILLLIRITVVLLSFGKIQLGRWEDLQPREMPPRPLSHGGRGTTPAQGHVRSSQRAKRLCRGLEAPTRDGHFVQWGEGVVAVRTHSYPGGRAPAPTVRRLPRRGRSTGAAPGAPGTGGRWSPTLPTPGSPATPGPFAFRKAAAVEPFFPHSHHITTFSSLQDERQQLF